MDRQGAVAPGRPSQQQGAGSQLLRAVKAARLHRRPRLLTAAVLWMLGLFAMFLSPAPVSITDAKMAAFEQKIALLSKSDKPRLAAEQRWLAAEREVQRSKEWFWRFKPEARERVGKKQAAAAALQREHLALEAKAKQQYHAAKAELGLWSDAGLEEGRALFWRSFERGKVFGRRQTLWDGLMTLLASREEGLVGLLVQLILQAMVNFTTGMAVSVLVFVWQLPAFLASYQPSLLGGAAFFVIATVSALSVLASFLLTLYGAGATAIYAMATISPNYRIRGGRRGYRGSLHYHAD